MQNKAFSKIWFIIILFVIIGGGYFAWQYLQPKELDISSLKNAEYLFPRIEDMLQFEDGKFEDQEVQIIDGDEDWVVPIYARIYDDRIAFGNLDNDNDEDAAVVTTINQGGSGDFRYLVIMENQNGKPVYLTSTALGDRVIINSLNIESGIITLEMIVHAPGDDFTGYCCPSLEKVFKYKLSAEGFLEQVEV